MFDDRHFLKRKLLEECSPNTRVILVGDSDQLGPINAGRPFADMIESAEAARAEGHSGFPVTRLDRIFRFAEGGAIAVAAQAINSGDVSCIVDGSLNGPELEFIPCAEPQEIAAKVCELAARSLPAAEIKPNHIQALTPVHKGVCGRHSLNAAIRAALGRSDKRAAIGDRLIQMTNDKECGLLNGEIGIVTYANDECMTVRFDGRMVIYNKNALAKNREHGPTNHLDWANVITVHNLTW
jgi:exodeoxyribonuclease V alpha subunit